MSTYVTCYITVPAATTGATGFGLPATAPTTTDAAPTLGVYVCVYIYICMCVCVCMCVFVYFYSVHTSRYVTYHQYTVSPSCLTTPYSTPQSPSSQLKCTHNVSIISCIGGFAGFGLPAKSGPDLGFGAPAAGNHY